MTCGGNEVNWTDIYTKYKDTELMKEFTMYLGYGNGKSVVDWNDINDFWDIKDIWGYLICFAETKGYTFFINDEGTVNNKTNFTAYISEIYGRRIAQGTNLQPIEQALIWCADKFFEVAK